MHRGLQSSIGAHADYVDPVAFAAFLGEMQGLHFDVMFEAKAKEWAAVRVMEYLQEQGLMERLTAA